jgi:AraC-like DNA-binding protein
MPPKKMTSARQSREFVASYFDAWNQHDAKGVAAHLAEHGIYCDASIQLQHTRQQLIANLSDYFADDNHRYQLVGEVLTGKSTIAFQYRVTADGEADWMGAEFIIMHGDAAENISDFYQLSDFESTAGTDPEIRAVRRYAKSGLNPGQLGDLSRRLEALMEEPASVYLQPDLTLPQLAELLNCSVNHLSQVINAGFGKSFFDFINGFRIREATRLLSATDTAEAAILNVALAVGFNSTSTFYSAFKKVTGQTPAQFRRTQG